MAEAFVTFGAMGALLEKYPIEISPRLQNSDSAAQVTIICCSPGARASNKFDNRRIIYRNEKLEEHSDHMLDELFKKLCCCGSNQAETEENRVTIKKVEVHLVQTYGLIPTQIAPLSAGIDVNRKMHEGAPLTVKEFRRLEKAAQAASRQEDFLKNVRVLRLYERQLHPIEIHYHEMQQMAEPNREIFVKHSNGQKERFSKNKIKACLHELCTCEAIPENEIHDICIHIKEKLKLKNEIEVPSDLIRSLLAQELKTRGYDILPPNRLNTSEVEAIREKGLSPEIYFSFLQSFVRAEDSSSSDNA